MADVDINVEIPDFVDPGGYEDVSGNMAIQGSVGGAKSEEYNTLDEPIRDTIIRDLKAVGSKFYHVLYPKEKKALIKEWDLWGPLILCTFLAMVLQGSENLDSNLKNDGGPEFAEVFVIVWVGSAVITLNSKLLGGNISFFQSVCVLGYCLLPSCISLIICKIILFASRTNALFVLRFVITCLGFVWASYAAMKFLGDSQPASRRVLALYPIILFYFFIGWLIISHNNV